MEHHHFRRLCRACLSWKMCGCFPACGCLESVACSRCKYQIKLGEDPREPGKALRSFLSDAVKDHLGYYTRSVDSVQGLKYMKDTLGHGTKVLSVLFSIVPEATFYIGKVRFVRVMLFRCIVSHLEQTQVLAKPAFPVEPMINGLFWAFECKLIAAFACRFTYCCRRCRCCQLLVWRGAAL